MNAGGDRLHLVTGHPLVTLLGDGRIVGFRAEKPQPRRGEGLIIWTITFALHPIAPALGL